jgi:hypothetical protein
MALPPSEGVVHESEACALPALPASVGAPGAVGLLDAVAAFASMRP